jgi:ubiquinone biosynthesis protein COQ9
MDPQDNAPSDLFLARLTDAMLELAPESGWTQVTMDKAAETAGLTRGQALLAAPNGVADVLEEFGRRAAKAASGAVLAADNMKVREKVRAGVKGWLGALGAHKTAVKRAATTPANLLTGPKGLWAAADAIWAALGDKSTDYNWYTKRMTLSAVLASTLAAWMGTDDEAQVDEFLDRRIENVMQFEKLKAQAKDAFAKMPDPMDIFGARKT